MLALWMLVAGVFAVAIAIIAAAWILTLHNAPRTLTDDEIREHLLPVSAVEMFVWPNGHQDD